MVTDDAPLSADPSGVWKAFKYKLRPTPAQERKLETWLDLCRRLYNTALDQRRYVWKTRRAFVTLKAQQHEIPGLRAACPEYQSVNAHVLYEILRRVDVTYQTFFARLRRGEKAGHPRFRGKARFDSFTYREYGSGRTGNGTYVNGSYVALGKFGHVRIFASRPLEGKPKSITVRREVDGWYVLVQCENVPIHALEPTGMAVGLDLGLETFAHLSDGTTIQNPHFYQKAESQLARLQRRIQRRAAHGSRWRKAVAQVAKLQQRVARQRRDFQHKSALSILRKADLVCYEDLSVAGLARAPHLTKTIFDVGWAGFITILSHKAVCAGRRTVAVSARFTSQLCSGCGAMVPKNLKMRRHICPDCGIELHRDLNAAVNILKRGVEQSQGGQSCQAQTWAVRPSVA